MTLKSRLERIEKQLHPPVEEPAFAILITPASELCDEQGNRVGALPGEDSVRQIVFNSKGEQMEWASPLPRNTPVKCYEADEDGLTVYDLV